MISVHCQDNMVAGVERVAYRIQGDSCRGPGIYIPPNITNEYSNNEAHSAMSGVNLWPTDKGYTYDRCRCWQTSFNSVYFIFFVYRRLRSNQRIQVSMKCNTYIKPYFKYWYESLCMFYKINRIYKAWYYAFYINTPRNITINSCSSIDSQVGIFTYVIGLSGNQIFFDWFSSITYWVFYV